MRDQVSMRASANLFQQATRLGTIDTSGRRPPGIAKTLKNAHSLSANAANCSVWCSVVSALVSSARSLSMIASILYSVRLMR